MTEKFDAINPEDGGFNSIEEIKVLLNSALTAPVYFYLVNYEGKNTKDGIFRKRVVNRDSWLKETSSFKYSTREGHTKTLAISQLQTGKYRIFTNYWKAWGLAQQIRSKIKVIE